ncbi:MAG: AMP-binding protein, partial [Bacteroidota bacterium]
FIHGRFYSYHQLSIVVSSIREVLKTKGNKEHCFALVGNDDVETYASILALWLEWKAYIPLNPGLHLDRNEYIIQQSGVRTVLDSSTFSIYQNLQVISTTKIPCVDHNPAPGHFSENRLAYIAFTSGSTGVPKGVPITRGNFAAFIDSFNALGIRMDENDRCLQMFDLTFDLSITSIVLSLMHGACLYTVPKEVIKYQYVIHLMEENKLTFAILIPSIVQYLRPYFAEINCPEMRYNLFCGEALQVKLVEEWSHCLPNAAIINIYGPTEHTVVCTAYEFSRDFENKSVRGILSIGKPMKGTRVIIIDENGAEADPGETGELCLSGPQLMAGYINKEENIDTVFIDKDENEQKIRFYKTGDICLIDQEGYILFLGRKDHQVKIQGFRVELTEIEYHIRNFLPDKNSATVALSNQFGTTELGLIIESAEFEHDDLLDYLKKKLPIYMVPKQVKFVDAIPINPNGKSDRKAMISLFDEILSMRNRTN